MDTTLTLILNGSDNLYLSSIAFLATKIWIWFPLYAAIIYALVREHNFRQFLIITLALMATIFVADQVASGIFKPLVARWRPTHNPQISHLVDIVNGYRGGNYGFFSSHASNTAATTTFLALLFRHRSTSITLVCWTLINCWTRLYLGVHFLGDIITGLLFGNLIGSIFYIVCRHLLLHYAETSQHINHSPTRLSVISTIFLLTLVIITIPWYPVF